MKEVNDSKFVTRNWDVIHDQTNVNYNAGNEIVYSIGWLKPNLCDHNNVYILVRGYNALIGHNFPTKVEFKNCRPFIMFITKSDGTKINDAEDLDFVMSMYNLLKQLFLRLILRRIKPFKYFKYKDTLLENSVGENGILKSK